MFDKKSVDDSVESQCIKPPRQQIAVDATDHTVCPNEPVNPDPITTGAIAKIPVVLAELTVQINLDAFITLPEYAIEIKRIGKRVKITQCRLLQNTNKLFIRGFVRKNIEYATATAATAVGVCGNVNHCTVDVPFSCVTPIEFNVLPPTPAQFNTADQFGFLVEQDLGPDFPAKDQLLSNDLSQFNQVTNEYFNELVFCELISATITEFNEALNFSPLPGVAPFEEIQFNNFLEKMVIDLTLKVLQKQQVAIPRFYLPGSDNSY